MVTDGEIPDPDKALVEELDRVKAEMGLKARFLHISACTSGRANCVEWSSVLSLLASSVGLEAGCGEPLVPSLVSPDWDSPTPTRCGQVHALLVGAGSNDAIDALASNTHVFRSW